ncbi:MAG: NADH-quinone oxidoreductase subunit J [Thermodesulfobacteriota bacterium]
MKTIVFNLFALLAILPCFWVALSPNIFHAAFSLLVTLFGVAGLYILLGADFIGLVQVVVYIGGILVLIIFGLMMTQGARLIPGSRQVVNRISAAILALLILAALVHLAYRVKWPLTATPVEAAPTTEGIGDLLLGRYLVPFEVISFLLLAALVGAVLIARHHVKEG